MKAYDPRTRALLRRRLNDLCSYWRLPEQLAEAQRIADILDIQLRHYRLDLNTRVITEIRSEPSEFK